MYISRVYLAKIHSKVLKDVDRRWIDKLHPKKRLLVVVHLRSCQQGRGMGGRVMGKGKGVHNNLHASVADFHQDAEVVQGHSLSVTGSFLAPVPRTAWQRASRQRTRVS